jgi:hypothetical protein
MKNRWFVMAALVPAMVAAPGAAQIADRVGTANSRVRDIDRDRPDRATGVGVAVARTARERERELERMRECRYDGRRDDRDVRYDVRYDDRYDPRRPGGRDDRDDRYGRDDRDDRYDRNDRDDRDDRDNRYDDRYDRRGGQHDWSGGFERSYSRDCLEYANRVSVNIRFGNWFGLGPDLMYMRSRLNRQHEQWHRAHGWHPRNPGWVRAHRALHMRLMREYDRFWVRW